MPICAYTYVKGLRKTYLFRNCFSIRVLYGVVKVGVFKVHAVVFQVAGVCNAKGVLGLVCTQCSKDLCAYTPSWGFGGPVVCIFIGRQMGPASKRMATPKPQTLSRAKKTNRYCLTHQLHFKQNSLAKTIILHAHTKPHENLNS